MPKSFKDYVKEQQDEGTYFTDVPQWNDDNIIEDEAVATPEKIEAAKEDVPVWNEQNIINSEVEDPDNKFALPESLAIKLAQGGGMGMTEYLAGGVGALGRIAGIKGLGNAMKDVDFSGFLTDATLNPTKLEEEYDKAYKTEQQLQREIFEEDPITSVVGNLAGGIATGRMLPTKLVQPLGPAKEGLSTAARIGHNVKNAVASGAILGAAMPTQSPDLVDSDALKERLINAGIGGVAGGVLTGAIEGIPAVAKAGADKFGKAIKNTSFGAGFEAGKKGMILKTDKHDAYLANLIDDDLKIFRNEIGGINDVRVKGLAEEISDTNAVIDDITSKIKLYTDAKDKLLKDTTKELVDENKLKLINLIDAEKSKFDEALTVAKRNKAKLILDNSDIFKTTTNEIKSFKNELLSSMKNEIDDLQRSVDVVLPDQMTSELGGDVQALGKSLQGNYKKINSGLDAINKKIISDYQQDLTKYNGELPEELFNKYVGLGFNGKNVKNMPTSFNFNAKEPITNFIDKISEISNLPATDKDKSTLLKISDGISKLIQNHSPGLGPISLENFQSLMNTRQIGKDTVEAAINPYRDLALSLENKTIGRAVLDQFKKFNDSMRLVQAATVEPLDSRLSKYILDTNKKYANFSALRRAVISGNESVLDPKLIDSDTAIRTNIKNYLLHGADLSPTKNFLDGLASSPNKRIKDFLTKLENAREKVVQFKSIVPDDNIFVKELDDLLSGVKAADVADINLQQQEQIQGIQNILNKGLSNAPTPLKSGVSVAERLDTPIQNLKKVLSNISEINRIESGADNPESIERLKFLKDEISKIMSDGRVTTALDDLNIDENFKKQLKGLASQRYEIDNNLNPRQTSVIGKFNQNMTQMVDGEPKILSDILSENEEYLKNLKSPKVNSLLDKLLKVYDDETKFYQQLQSMMEKGADPSELKTLGSKRKEFDLFLDEVLKDSQLMAPDVRARLEQMVQTMKAREEHLRGVMSAGSIGLWSSIPGFAGNALGLGKPLSYPLRAVGQGVKRAAQAVAPNIDAVATKNTLQYAEQLKKYTKMKMFDSVLKNVNSNINEFNAMNMTRRAAIINSLMQNPDTRETAKQMQEEYLGK